MNSTTTKTGLNEKELNIECIRLNRKLMMIQSVTSGRGDSHTKIEKIKDILVRDV